METSIILAIIGGVVGVTTIIAHKCKCYTNRNPEGEYSITFGMLDKPLPIAKEE